jgi:hypothetical protein
MRVDRPFSRRHSSYTITNFDFEREIRFERPIRYRKSYRLEIAVS